MRKSSKAATSSDSSLLVEFSCWYLLSSVAVCRTPRASGSDSGSGNIYFAENLSSVSLKEVAVLEAWNVMQICLQKSVIENLLKSLEIHWLCSVFGPEVSMQWAMTLLSGFKFVSLFLSTSDTFSSILVTFLASRESGEPQQHFQEISGYFPSQQHNTKYRIHFFLEWKQKI